MSVEAETISLKRPNAAGAVAALSTQQWLPVFPPLLPPLEGLPPQGDRERGPQAGLNLLTEHFVSRQSI